MNGEFNKKVVKCLLVFLAVSFSVKAQKPPEVKVTEVIVTDSIPLSELFKRAVKWASLENPKYTKLNSVSVGSKAECSVGFPVKPKELNPDCDFTGKIFMKVSIECKENRYRYVINQIKHISASGNTSAGAIENKLPECGSMAMNELVWKKLKGEALRNVAVIAASIKDEMKKESVVVVKDEW